MRFSECSHVNLRLTFVVYLSILQQLWCMEAGSVCKTPNGENGHCISLYECGPILDAISTRTPETLRFSKQSHCGCDESEPLVCCGTQSSFTPVTQIQTQTETTVTQSSSHSTMPETTYTQATETMSQVTVTETDFPQTIGSHDSEEKDDDRLCNRTCGCPRKDEIFAPRCLDAGAVCQTPNEERANCISLYECDVILDAIAARTPDALNFSKLSHCGCDDAEPFVCCGSHSGFVVLNHTKPPEMESTTTSTTTTEMMMEMTEPPHVPPPMSLNNTLLASKRICGYQGKEDRLGNRKFVQVDEYPWLAAVYSNASNRPVCFGSLISKRYVLTSGACLMPSTGIIIRIRLGDYEVSKNGVNCAQSLEFEECSEPPMDYRVEETIVHEDFNLVRSYEHDIGLIRLAKNVRYTDYIRPICLPDAETKLAMVGDILHSSGWSYLRKQGEIAKIKKKSKSKIMTEDDCKLKGGNAAAYYKPSSMICTKNALPGLCLGDTGVPLMYPNKFQWHLEGILSYARNEGICDVDNIVLSTRVTDYLDWIIGKIKP